MRLRRPLVIGGALVLVGALVVGALVGPLGALASETPPTGGKTAIQHVVVIFQENVSFDHYFGTYPHATNPAGEPRFTPRADTPTVNGLTDALLTHNPNAANPARLDRSQALTCDQDHKYTDEEKSFDHGLMDKFVQFVSGGSCADKSIVMDYYDGNTVTALWNYAQRYAMSDNSFGTNFGPSTVGALNLIAGQTHGATPDTIAGQVAQGTVIADPQPLYDDCAAHAAIAMSGKNVGDLLNAKNITWGWFQGGFRPSGATNGAAACATAHQNIGGATVTDYIPHHEPFQYYRSTANPHHLPPSAPARIGQTDQANHQYDLADFWTAVDAGKTPAVSFLKAAAYQDGHAGYSDPLDEQHFLVDTINRLEQSRAWGSTAVIVAYDDSDGWYDHAMGPIVSQSNDATFDALAGAGLCGAAPPGAYEDRCGYGPRLPLLVISPFARRNFVDHAVTDQTSILRFIEDNWGLGRIGDQSFDALAGSLDNMLNLKADDDGKLILDPGSGEPK